jgi:hypothetical protein
MGLSIRKSVVDVIKLTVSYIRHLSDTCKSVQFCSLISQVIFNKSINDSHSRQLVRDLTELLSRLLTMNQIRNKSRTIYRITFVQSYK